MSIVIVGGGVVGLHVGIALAEASRHRPILLCEREPSLGRHTSGRNSEVIHAGFAYPVGSLKAELCVEGNRRTYEWLRRLGTAHVQCGKWVVAVDRAELTGLAKVLEVGAACGVEALRESSAEEVRRSEPGCRRFAGAAFSGTSGIMDAAAYVRALEVYFGAREGCHVLASGCVTGIDPERRIVSTSRGAIRYEVLVNAAGLWADDVYRMAGGPRRYRIKPFKGEYLVWPRGPVRTMVYPVPRRYLPGGEDDVRLVSSMGMHVHRSVGGTVLVGPTQVELDWTEKGDYRITTPHQAFVRAAAAIAPLDAPDALQDAYAGNRPKLYQDGVPVGDFRIERDGPHVHLLGIESPGLTAAPALAMRVAGLVRQALA
jgi:L-2-hydroxyglutarate oxidase LhgO